MERAKKEKKTVNEIVKIGDKHTHTRKNKAIYLDMIDFHSLM